MKRHVFICYAIIAFLLILSACSKYNNPIKVDTESHITDDLVEATTTTMTTALTQETTRQKEDRDPTISSERVNQNQQSYLEIIPDSKNIGEVYDEQNGYSFVDISNIANDIEANRIFFIQASDINDQSIIKHDFNKDNKEDLLVIKKKSYLGPAQPRSDSSEYEFHFGNSIIYYYFVEDLDYGPMSDLKGIGIFDVDHQDQYIEFFVTTESYNGIYMETTIFRMNTNQDIELKAVIGSLIVGTSGDGKVYYWGGNLDENESFDPALVLNYYDINLGIYVDTDQIIGKTLDNFGGVIIFENENDVPTGAPVLITMEFPGAIRELRNKEKITILQIGDDTAKIRCEDGLTGWIGGFHMVWD